MAQSTQRAVSDGTLVSLDLSINYLDRSEIAVYFDSALTTAWAWVGETAKQITFSPAVPNGVEVLIKRTTGISKLRHEFSKGAAFTAEVLDEDLTQVLHIAQEASESNLSGQFYSDIDMHNYRIHNIGPAVDDTDALTLGQYKADALGAFASKTAAAASASAAAGSATAAAGAATTAGTHATNAGNSASAAAASASAAATSVTNAANASRLTEGTVTTGAPGTDAYVTISGPAGSQVIDFVIPRGDTGATGPQGPQGVPGVDGADGTSVKLKGAVPTFGDLPTGAAEGDLYVVVATGDGYVFDGSVWVNVGPIRGPKGDTGPAGSTTWAGITDKPTLGTAAPLNVAASGNAAAGEVVKGDDTRLSDSREWSAATVDQAEAAAGTGTTRRAWTAQRVRQAIAAWWDSVKGALVGPIGINGDLEFTGTARRIRGDFSNATTVNRVMFQTSTVNGNTQIRVIPNGAGNEVSIQAGNSSDPSNSSVAILAATPTEAQIISAANGTGTLLPMTFHTGGAERMRIDTGGKVTLSNELVLYRLGGETVYAGFTNGAVNTLVGTTGGGTYAASLFGNTTNHVVAFFQNNNERLRLDTVGNTLHIGPNGGLGYGAGAGGTVAQSTGKSTGVTLNKPTGQITMHNAALAAGASVVFNCNNILVDTSCVVVANPVFPGASSAYEVKVTSTGSGFFTLKVTNVSAGSRSDALPIQFSVFKGATS